MGLLGIGLLLLEGFSGTEVHVWGPGGLDGHFRGILRRAVLGREKVVLMNWVRNYLN